MKKVRILLFVLVGAFCFSQPAEAQGFLKKMAKRALKKTEQKTEERVNKKVDEGIDKSLDRVEDSLEQKNRQDTVNMNQSEGYSREAANQARMQRMMKSMGITGKPVPIEKSYNFQSSIHMNVKTYKKDGSLQSDGTIVVFMNPGKENFAYEFTGQSNGQDAKGKGTFIYDFKNKASIILSDEKGKHTGIVYGLNMMMDSDSLMQMEHEKQNDGRELTALNPNLKKTGRTKIIAGYKCDEYAYNDEMDKATFWITKDIKWESRDLMSTAFKSTMYSHGMPWGFLMESESYDKETGEKSVFKVTDVTQRANKVFNLSNYQITNMGALKMPKTENEK